MSKTTLDDKGLEYEVEFMECDYKVPLRPGEEALLRILTAMLPQAALEYESYEPMMSLSISDKVVEQAVAVYQAFIRHCDDERQQDARVEASLDYESRAIKIEETHKRVEQFYEAQKRAKEEQEQAASQLAVAE